MIVTADRALRLTLASRLTHVVADEDADAEGGGELLGVGVLEEAGMKREIYSG